MLESVQLHLCTVHFSLHKEQEQVVSTTRQSTTTSLPVENAVYTTTMEVTHSCSLDNIVNTIQLNGVYSELAVHGQH